MRTDRPPTRGDGALFVALLALLVWLPVPWGSNSAWAKSVLACSAAGLLSMWLATAALGRIRTSTGRWPPVAPMLWWAMWLLWVGMALWPMSTPLLMRLAPDLQLHADAAVHGISLRQAWAIMPTATVEAWLLSAGYACLYLLTMLTCKGEPERQRMVLITLVISGTLQALYGSLMVLSGVEWGFLQAKQHYLHVATGTFVNRNHLAGYIELSGAAALGLILSELGRRSSALGWRQRLQGLVALLFSRKLRVRLALAIMAIALVMTHSRSGNVAFVAALGGCGMLYVVLRHRDRAFRAFLVISSVLLVDLLVVTQWYGLDRLAERIEQTEIEANGRARIIEASPPVIETYWRTGSGLGSFATAFAPFNPGAANEYFVHAHNDYLQFLIETGIPGLILLAVFVGAHGLHAIRVLALRRSRVAAAVGFSALMAIAAIAMHSFTDFNLQIPANAATLIVLCALAASVSARSRRRQNAAGMVHTEGLDSENAVDRGTSHVQASQPKADLRSHFDRSTAGRFGRRPHHAERRRDHCDPRRGGPAR
jgi:putative inorganic carbon (hco3(-)) transporter